MLFCLRQDFGTFILCWFSENRVRTPRNLGLLIMSVFIPLHRQGMVILLMERQLVCVLDVLSIMILRRVKKILLRMVCAATSFATQSPETKLK